MFRIWLAVLFFVVDIFAIDATMEIVKQTNSHPKIAIVNSLDNQNSDISKKIYKAIEADLRVSGHFDIFRDGALKESFDSRVNVVKLSKSAIDLFLKYKIEDDSDELKIIVKLFDVNSQEEVFTKTYFTSDRARYPFLSHKLAIDLNNYIKAPSIDWMERFVIFSRYVTPKESEIVIADYTLTYEKTIIRGGLNIFPKWADKHQNTFYYTAYLDKPTLVKVDIYTGKRENIISSEGMLVCSDVSRDGTKLLLTKSPEYQPDIYLFDVNSKNTKKVTSYKGIDVSGHFIEDDSKVAFVSDRLGYPNIFSKRLYSSGVERLVYHGKNNNSCTTFKDYIVYTSRDSDNEFAKNSFNLYLISTKSDYIRKLTSIGVNQFPKFSEDGESLLFIKQYKGESSLGIIRIYYNKSFLFPLKRGKIQSIDW
jgi:TolB protein